MNISMTPAFEDSIDVLTEMRMRFMHEFEPGHEAEDNTFAEKATRAYLTEQFALKNYIGYIGSLDGEVICAAGLLLYRLPPVLSRTERLQGHLLSVYTKPEYRSRGLGSSMMQFIIDDARSRGIFRIYLNATPAGEPLYRKFGFCEEHEAALTKVIDLPEKGNDWCAGH